VAPPSDIAPGKEATQSRRQLKLSLLQQLPLHLDEPEAVKALYDARVFKRKKGQARKPAKPVAAEQQLTLCSF